MSYDSDKFIIKAVDADAYAEYIIQDMNKIKASTHACFSQ
jgi:hypothetical protein